MNCSYRSRWNDNTGTHALFTLKRLAVSLMLAFSTGSHALPVDGVVVAGGATISSTGNSTTITQSTQNVAINWQSFSIAAGQSVLFVQPSSSSVALNRVIGADPSSILGNLSSNGKVFLVNPNGILFGSGASINVGGLVASTLNISDSDFMASQYQFTGNSNASVVNQDLSTINADGGFVALLGANVSNQGTIVARLGSVALAAGNAITLDVAGDGLLNVAVNQGAVNALIENGGLIQADGGQVLLTAKSAGALLQSAVNNNGVIRAQTLVNRNGTIMLMGDMESGTTNVGGTLDASAPNGGNGGFIETSAAHVNIADDAQISTAAPGGQTGTWLIDPVDFNIRAIGGDITGLALTNLLVNNNVTISTMVTGTNTLTTFFAAPGQGDINVDDVIGVGSGALWTAAGVATTLTLNAARDVNINQTITATKGNLVACCGRDVNVNAAITITNGSTLLAGTRNVNQSAAITSVDGNVAMCAGGDINITAALSSTRGTVVASESLASLGVQQGLTFMAGQAATGPGLAGGGGAVNISPPGGTVTVVQSFVVGEEVPVRVIYNPLNYVAPVIDYSLKFTTFNPLTVQRLVFPGGADRVANTTTTAIFTSLQGNPGGVTLGGAGIANFATSGPGLNIPITYSGFTLGGASAGFALPAGCCGVATRTTGTISPSIPPVVPGVGSLLPIISLLPDELLLADTTWMPTVVPGETPAQLASIAPPPVAPMVTPVEEVPPVYAPPLRFRKNDRN